jgi:hypothetical protein
MTMHEEIEELLSPAMAYPSQYSRRNVVVI